LRRIHRRRCRRPKTPQPAASSPSSSATTTVLLLRLWRLHLSLLWQWSNLILFLVFVIPFLIILFFLVIILFLLLFTLLRLVHHRRLLHRGFPPFRRRPRSTHRPIVLAQTL